MFEDILIFSPTDPTDEGSDDHQHVMPPKSTTNAQGTPPGCLALLPPRHLEPVVLTPATDATVAQHPCTSPIGAPIGARGGRGANEPFLSG